MRIGIIIVNYKTPLLVIECLRSLVSEHAFENFQTIVVDNNSQDGSFEKISSTIIAEGWFPWASVHAAEHNGGFAYGNNLAIRQFMSCDNAPEYIYLLNSDAMIRENAIQELASFLDNHPQVGIVGSRLENLDGSPRHACFQFHTYVTELDRGFSLSILSKLLSPWVVKNTNPTAEIKTDWVAGASMMVRSTVFNTVGLMDESYFLYYEEMDFCLQAKRAGWECWYVPASRVVHFAGQSSGITHGRQQTSRRPRYWFESRRRYFVKNFGVIHAFFADLFWLVGFATWRLRNIFQKKEHSYAPHLLLDSFANSVFIRGFKILPVRNR
jgi:N-acetylglucosaminyl-diphospho-decaprenol L-rhamnosyltransferase